MAGGGGARWLGAGQLRGDAGVRFRRVRTGPAGLGARLSPPRFHRVGAQVLSNRAAVRLRRQTQDQKMKANNVAIGSGTPMNHTRKDLPTISSDAGLPPANANRGVWFRPRGTGIEKSAWRRQCQKISSRMMSGIGMPISHINMPLPIAILLFVTGRQGTLGRRLWFRRRNDCHAALRPPWGTTMTDGLPLPRRYLAIGALCLGSSLVIIDGGVANVALPTIARDLGVDSSAVVLDVTVNPKLLVMLLLPL